MVDVADELGESRVAHDLADGRCLADVGPVVIRDALELITRQRRLGPRVVSEGSLQVRGRQRIEECIGTIDDTLPGRPHLGQVGRRRGSTGGDEIQGGLDPKVLRALQPDQTLVPGQVTDHPGDGVHRFQPAMGVLGGQTVQAAAPLGSGEAQLFDSRVGHRRSVVASDVPSRPASGVQPLSRPTDLPSHVQRIVDEIENEIGDEPGRAEALIEGDGAAGHGADGRVEAAVREILLEIGEDPDRQGLVGTPGRVHRMYTELTAGYHVDPERLINGAIFDIAYSEMVVVKDIPFYSLCEHHLLPFFGTAAVAYIPRGRVIGLSKIPRVVEMYARRLQVQERLTQQVAEFLQERLAPQGVGVVVEATHLCAVMRGVRKPGTIMTTSSVLGLFRTRDRTRAEFFAHLERRSPGA